MSNPARVEVLHPGTTNHFEYWQDRSGTVRLFRRHEGPWMATLHGRVATERVELEDDVQVVGTTPLRSGTVEGLVALLAMQENVHALLDDSRRWGRGDAAGWLEPHAEARRPDEIVE